MPVQQVRLGAVRTTDLDEALVGHAGDHDGAGRIKLEPRADTTAVRGWWRNRVSRTLLVFLFSTLGSAAGTYVAGFLIYDRLNT